MICSYGVSGPNQPICSIFQKKVLDLCVANFLKSFFEFILCPHKIGTIVTSHAFNIASSGNHSLKCHNK